ncbi:tetratricopeptide repeat protein [Thalassoroseus pseudoceratinae]|uniref:tetratricopeptide repeat protein n=1 Tax=Thalassoroseus pseudoceratinae TaxID=2713176 RepID=UPI00142490BF|nr:tetratricopeptide repeat protein [Thalassoroseus pseudoceratinae]
MMVKLATQRTNSVPKLSRYKQLAAARHAVNARNFRAAKALLKACVMQNREDGRAWELFGRVHYLSANYPLAISAFERASLAVTLSDESQVSLASAYARSGQFELATDMLSKLAENQELSAPLLLDVAISLDLVDRPDLSMTACRNAAKQSPEHAQIYYDLAYYSERCGYPKTTTERMVRKAIRRDPGNLRYRIGLASSLFKQDRFDDAYELVQELPASKIVTLSCSGCLEQLEVLFRRANDESRVIACRQRLVELRLRGCGFEC